MVWGPCGSVSAAKVQGRAALLGERSIGRHWATSLAGREEKGRTKRWRAGEDCAVGPGQCCSIALLVVVVAGAFRQPARHPRTSPKGLRRCSVSSTRHAHAGQLSCPTPHQLLDFLHQRDSCVATSTVTPHAAIRGRQPCSFSPGEATSGDRRGFVLRRHTEGWSGRALTQA
jgi:hypothetical protein